MYNMGGQKWVEWHIVLNQCTGCTPSHQEKTISNIPSMRSHLNWRRHRILKIWFCTAGQRLCLRAQMPLPPASSLQSWRSWSWMTGNTEQGCRVTEGLPCHLFLQIYTCSKSSIWNIHSAVVYLLQMIQRSLLFQMAEKRVFWSVPQHTEVYVILCRGLCYSVECPCSSGDQPGRKPCVSRSLQPWSSWKKAELHIAAA